jgi:hypothetical protein
MALRNRTTLKKFLLKSISLPIVAYPQRLVNMRSGPSRAMSWAAPEPHACIAPAQSSGCDRRHSEERSGGGPWRAPPGVLCAEMNLQATVTWPCGICGCDSPLRRELITTCFQTCNHACPPIINGRTERTSTLKGAGARFSGLSFSAGRLSSRREHGTLAGRLV